jgi:S1-C subfamily serine protease
MAAGGAEVDDLLDRMRDEAPGDGMGGSVPFRALPEPPRHRRPRRWVAALVSALTAAALVEGGIIIGQATGEPAEVDAIATASDPAVTASTSSVVPSDLPSVIDAAMDSVVAVRSISAVTGPFGRSATAESLGSGVVVADGIVLTNAHVVEGASEVTVSFGDERAEVSARVLGTDESHDLAVLAVDTGGRAAISIGTSSGLELGDTVVALGYPLGLGSTATAGIVSGLNRTIDVSNGSQLDVTRLQGLLQTDAAINPGNSGGPLIDEAGQLVGINTAGASASSAENIGFAIAIDEALPIAERLAGTSL